MTCAGSTGTGSTPPEQLIPSRPDLSSEPIKPGQQVVWQSAQTGRFCRVVQQAGQEQLVCDALTAAQGTPLHYTSTGECVCGCCGLPCVPDQTAGHMAAMAPAPAPRRGSPLLQASAGCVCWQFNCQATTSAATARGKWYADHCCGRSSATPADARMPGAHLPNQNTTKQHTQQPACLDTELMC